MPEYYHAKFGGNWKTNKGETEEYRDKNGCWVFYTSFISCSHYAGIESIKLVWYHYQIVMTFVKHSVCIQYHLQVQASYELEAYW